jgi:hypothetical protein
VVPAPEKRPQVIGLLIVERHKFSPYLFQVSRVISRDSGIGFIHAGLALKIMDYVFQHINPIVIFRAFGIKSEQAYEIQPYGWVTIIDLIIDACVMIRQLQDVLLFNVYNADNDFS